MACPPDRAIVATWSSSISKALHGAAGAPRFGLNRQTGRPLQLVLGSAPSPGIFGNPFRVGRRSDIAAPGWVPHLSLTQKAVSCISGSAFLS
jgi:hypothetical protein